MATGLNFEQMIQGLLSTTVKQESPEEEGELEVSSFCYETLTKEEVILEEVPIENPDGQPKSASDTSTKISREQSFQCSVCNRTFDLLFKRNRCLKRHDAVKTERYKCTFCGKCFASNHNKVRHEAWHKKETEKRQVYLNFLDSKRDKSDPPQKEDNSSDTPHKEGMSVETAIPQNIDVVQEIFPEVSEIPASVSTYVDAFKKFTLDCTLYNKLTLERHERDKGIKNQSSIDAAVSEPAVQMDNEEAPQLNENSSHFCYETLTKEELIIGDEKVDETAENEQEKDSRYSLEEHQPMEDKEITLLKDTRVGESAVDEQEDEFRFWLDEDEPELEATSSQQGDQSIESRGQESAPKHKCKMCQLIFNSEYVLQLHYRTHNPVVMRTILSEQCLVHNKEAQNYKCLFCEATYPSRTQMALTHLQKHINVIDGIFQCKICGLRLGTNGAYQKHLNTHNNTSNQMPPPRVDEDSHIDYESLSKDPCESNLPLHCKTCNVFFNNKANLNIHLWKSKLRIVRSQIDVAAAKKQPVVTDEQFDPVKKSTPVTVKKDAVIHQRLTKQVDPVKIRNPSTIKRDETGFYNCSKCPYKANRRQLLSRHVLRHRALELGLFSCDVCRIRCSDKSHLAKHKESHENRNYVKCRTCNEKLATRAALHRHRIIHSKSEISRQFLEKVTEDEKGFYTCSICGKKNMEIRKNALIHFRTHMPKKFLECVVCQKRCLSKNALQRHMETHEKLRFKCHTCNERFETRPALMRHREIHKPDDIYQCSRCEEKFGTRQKVLEHYRVHRPPKLQSKGPARTSRANTRRGKTLVRDPGTEQNSDVKNE